LKNFGEPLRGKVIKPLFRLEARAVRLGICIESVRLRTVHGLIFSATIDIIEVRVSGGGLWVGQTPKNDFVESRAALHRARGFSASGAVTLARSVIAFATVGVQDPMRRNK
jgi:hypothetical protein